MMDEDDDDDDDDDDDEEDDDAGDGDGDGDDHDGQLPGSGFNSHKWVISLCETPSPMVQ